MIITARNVTLLISSGFNSAMNGAKAVASLEMILHIPIVDEIIDTGKRVALPKKQQLKHYVIPNLPPRMKKDKRI